jgi:undecaprenyl-diphosphatase
VEFSFFLAVFSLAAACGYSLLKSGFSMSPMEYAILGTGFAVSFVVAWFVIRFFIGFVSKKNFIPFGIYRIALAALVVLYFFLIKR